MSKSFELSMRPVEDLPATLEVIVSRKRTSDKPGVISYTTEPLEEYLKHCTGSEPEWYRLPARELRWYES